MATKAEIAEAKRKAEAAARAAEEAKRALAAAEAEAEDDDDDEEDEEDDSLGESGKKALKAERDRAKAAERKARELERKLAALTGDDDKTDYKTKFEETQKKLDELDAKSKAQERAALLDKVAKAHGLPDSLKERLQGDTEEALTADAKELAKVAKKPVSSNNDIGGPTSKNGDDGGATPPNTPTLKDGKIPAFSFVPKGAVVIPDTL